MYLFLQDAIYRIKQTFNAEFDQVMEKKVQEISKIKERNRRIRKIMEDLDSIEDVYEPSLGVIERPELLLVVEDSEVSHEKSTNLSQKEICRLCILAANYTTNVV